MADSDFLPALPITGRANKALLRDALVKRVIYPFFDGESPTTWTATVNGAIPAAIANSSGGIFFFDEADTTTAHDGVVCIVTADGKRYKTSNMTMPDSVKGIGIDEPPADPEIGDAYIVSSSPDGDWAYNPDEIAVYTIREWLFITPRVGRPIYVEGSDHYFMDENGDWLPVFIPSGGQIRDQSLVGGQRRYIVQNKTTNAPPGSPSPEVYWIVGPSPTGAWSGHAGKIATFYDGDSAWTIIEPKNGDEAFDIALLSNWLYYGGTWQFGGGAWSKVQHVKTTGTGSTTAASGSSAWQGTGTPTTSNRYLADNATITHQALSGKKLRFTYQAQATVADPSSLDGTWRWGIALFRDSDANAIAWMENPTSFISSSSFTVFKGSKPASVFVEFIITTDDSASHVYKIGLLSARITSTNSDFTAVQLRDFTMEELA